MIKISVLIPVYNAQSYIRACLLSVMNQTYRDLEIIVIDDGSEDKSLKICEKLKESDGRIRILRQKHQGVSSARNAGLYAALGEYVFFLDSDDVIHPCLLFELLGQAEHGHAALVFCTYIRFHDIREDKIAGREKAYRGSLRNLWKTGEARESLEWFHKKYSRELSCIGGKLIRRSVIGTERFDESLSEGEDTVFLYHICSKKVKLSCLEKEWYYYRQHSKSVSAFHADKIDVKSFRAYKVVRDNEYRKGHISWALEWEYRYVWRLLSKYLAAKNRKREESSKILKEMIKKEKTQLLYQKLPARTRALFEGLYLGCSYVPLVRGLWMLKQRIFRI